jgi:hypothetical protein
VDRFSQNVLRIAATEVKAQSVRWVATHLRHRRDTQLGRSNSTLRENKAPTIVNVGLTQLGHCDYSNVLGFVFVVEFLVSASVSGCQSLVGASLQWAPVLVSACLQ